MDAREKIEVTPEMIDAGVREFFSFDRDEDDPAEIVTGVYSAMRETLLLGAPKAQARESPCLSPERS